MSHIAQNRELAKKLLDLTTKTASGSTSTQRLPQPPREADAIVTHIEVNDRHGVGVLIGRLFGGYDNVLSVRSQDYYEGRQEFGAMHVCVSHAGASRDIVFWNVLQALRGATVKRVPCVPYFPDDA